jgi:hypothetical protein
LPDGNILVVPAPAKETDTEYIRARNLFPNREDVPVGWHTSTFWGVVDMPAAWTDKKVQRYLFLFTYGQREFLAGVVASKWAVSSSMSGKIWKILSGFEPTGGLLTPAILEPYRGQKIMVKVEPRESKGTHRWFPVVVEPAPFRRRA